jgi:hypothetical protein
MRSPSRESGGAGSASGGDAWLLAEGVETWAEMDAFLRLGVPLGQGYLLGRPAPPWSQLDPAVAERLRLRSSKARLVENVVSLLEEVAVEGEGPLPEDRIAVRVDRHRHPVALLLPVRRADDQPGHRVAPISLRVPASAGVAEVARRVVARPESCRFDPGVCVDDVGAVAGIVRVERILSRLAEAKGDRATAA